MLILDTDHLSILQRGGAGAARVRARLARHAPEEVATTIVTFEEQMRGWLAYLARARSLTQQVEAYGRLRTHLDHYRRIPVLDFDEQAAVHVQRLRKERIRMGAMDLKIAAIALAWEGTLLTRNLRDFGRVPGLGIQDFTA